MNLTRIKVNLYPTIFNLIEINLNILVVSYPWINLNIIISSISIIIRIGLKEL